MSEKAAQYTGAARIFGENLLPELGKITVPTLVVVGDDDFICDKVSQADRITKQIPSSYEIVVADAGHFCWFEQPKPFFDGVEGWLGKQGVKEQP